MAFLEPHSATTLSIKYRPGREEFYAPTASESIFTFGDFKIDRPIDFDVISANTEVIHFGPYSTIDNLGMSGYNANITTYVKPWELNLPEKDPLSYSYFSSFYTEVATAINNIIDNYPYVIVSKTDALSAYTIYDYDKTYDTLTGEITATGKIKLNTFINQGNVEINSGGTENSPSLISNFDKFGIQLAGDTEIHSIKDISLYRDSVTPANSYINFEISGTISAITNNTISTIYIRPIKTRTAEFTQNLSALENHLLYNGVLTVPDIENEEQNDDVDIEYEWPKVIDGFNPDNQGDDFESYKSDILTIAEYIDKEKTNIFLKTIIPENYLELDTDDRLYKTMVQTYAQEFDLLKKYIDSLAYAHSVTYDGQESVPEKFIGKLSELLGWKLSSGFNEKDLFEYLVGDQDTKTGSYTKFNLEIWKRILVNISWLYKKKGTRDALMFIFKLLGAPDCLIEFNEFVYNINQAVTNVELEQQFENLSKYVFSYLNKINTSFKINDHGYLNYQYSMYEFQEGGSGRGDGQNYINQWLPEFTPNIIVDNIKVQTGDSQYYGTENIINSKEINLNINPAKAVECDLLEWYQLGVLSGTSVSAMTLAQYIDYVYTSSINPRTRKTYTHQHTTWTYPELKNIYLTYYEASSSNSLTIESLESFLRLLEVQLQDYMLQLLPSTTILRDSGVVYRNTVFQRQKFVYKRGLNDGSEFQTRLSEIIPAISPVNIDSSADLGTTSDINVINISTQINTGISCEINQINLGNTIDLGINNVLNAHSISSLINISTIPFLPVNF